jgi:DsbC/DsbD-like thiol-disulfide interchange protein
MKPLIAFLATLVAQAAAAQPLPADLVRAEMRPGWQTADGTQMVALHLTMAPGWKTYWRSPGEAGIPPAFDWAGSENVEDLTIRWPRPHVADIAGYRTLVYPDELVLPIEVTPADAGRPVHLTARIDLGVCDEVCVPVSLSVMVTPSATDQPDPLIDHALATVPPSAASLGLADARCQAEPIRDGMRLTATLPVAGGSGDFAVIELADLSVWVAPVETREGSELVQVADLVPSGAKPFALNRADVLVTAFAGGEVIEFTGCKG